MDPWVEVFLRREQRALCANKVIEDMALKMPVIVRVESGEFYGVVVRKGSLAKVKTARPANGTGPLLARGEVLRPATPEDGARFRMLLEREREAMRVCKEKIAAHGLEMELSDAEWTFDAAKLYFYFTAEKRVDFRGLVKDLAATFRARIEFRQIGAREEARRFGGYGVCGQKLCCAAWLPDFEPVTLKMAKEQNPSLSPMKMTGSCGRLMCCLMYERDFYEEAGRKFPRPGTELKTQWGEARVERVDIFRDLVFVRDAEGVEHRMHLQEAQEAEKGLAKFFKAPFFRKGKENEKKGNKS
jgi:cell fate regulator YaaT (PSP1 superfamily)